MASHRTALISVAAVFVVAGSYGLYLAAAQTAPPEVAQSPMNIANVIPPAFVMGVDNSGSMSTDETLFRTSAGVGRFSGGSFFDSNGDPRESGGTAVSKHMDQTGTYADFYGALRGPEYNRAYFNPATEYLPWRTAAGAVEANSNTASAVEDPRGSGFGAAAPLTTFNFTTYLTASENWLSGKVMPAGTTYYNDRTCNRAPGSNSTSNTWVTLTQDKTFTSDCQTQFRYYPARVYLSDSAPPPPGFNLSRRVLVKGAGPQGSDLWRYDYLESNFTAGGVEAVQNFANWWTYYGNRNRAMIAAMTHSLADTNNMRVGYFQINPAPPSGNVVMRNLNIQSEKDALYASMRGLNASGNTPTRRATAYMVQQFTRTDAGAPIKLQCQKNAGMLFTDGYTNDNNSGLTGILDVGNADGSFPAPYGGGVTSSNTIADYAMYGYVTNLRPDLPAGKVPVPNTCASNPTPGMDCNADPHMNFYGVTLGARGAIYDVNAAATADPYVTPPSWGATGATNLSPANVDDIWHAAINSRGEFINANSPAEITAAMRRILAAVNEGASPSGTMGLTGSRVGSGSLTVQPSYESTNNGTDWYGRLRAETVAANPITGEATFTAAWEASSRLAAQGASGRNIRFGTTGGSVVPNVRDFVAGNLSLSDLCSNPLRVTACTPGAISALAGGGMNIGRAVAYLRGDQTDEGTLRTRTTILGDIVNSSPVVSSPTDDYGYKVLGGTLATSYTAYLENKKAANRPMVYVGANDGMFHVFDGRSAAPPGGNEVFAYIPATALGHMGNLLFPYVAADKNDQKFQHRFYVDGPVVVSDVNINGVWKTIAVGTTGAGGRGVFALDVTDPDSIAVLWEVNDLLTGNVGVSNNIGHVLGKPVIVPFKDAAGTVSWKAIFGNGYNSENQQARLFVVDVGTGAVSSILASESVAPAYNGLGNVVAVDGKRRNVANTDWVTGRDGYVDTVYAGDQNGAVWKFDLLGNNVAFSGQPLFLAQDSAGKRQSIMGGLTAATGPTGGVMLYFGTGSFSFTGDPDSLDIQTVYGILDKGTSVAGRVQLLQQTVGADSGGFRGTSSNRMGAGLSGWYLDLPAGERFVGYPRIESGIVFFPTYEPSAAASSDCSVNGTNWLYGLNALTGGAALTQVRIGSPTGTQPSSATGAVSLNTGGSAPVKDVAVMTTPRVAPLAGSATQAEIDAAVASQCSMVVRVAGAPPMYLPRPCGRQSWRQVR